MHIEQGGILDHEKIAIGVVEGIVGIHRYKIKIEGSENHAGTTPMYLRDDALVKASHIIGRLDTLVRETDRDLVGTVGVISIKPCAVNVIPGQAEFVIEMRDKNVANMDQVISRLQAEFSDYKMQMECILREGATAMDKNIQDTIRQSSQKRGHAYKNMYSGAGHDAINLAKVTPTGMIFIPSIKGVSHSIREKSDWTDVKNGTEVLLETIVALDRTINDKDGTVL